MPVCVATIDMGTAMTRSSQPVAEQAARVARNSLSPRARNPRSHPSGRQEWTYDACHMLLNEKLIRDWYVELGYWTITTNLGTKHGPMSSEDALILVHDIASGATRRWFDWQWIRERTGLSIRRARNASKILSNQPL
jgi:hypothetical protein